MRWAEHAKIGYFAQDHSADFAEPLTLFAWITQWQPPRSDEQLLRATLGRMLFSRDESEKKVQVVSGGEQSRLLFGKLMLQKPNVLVFDEPTNHLDLESINALNVALQKYEGTVLLVTHDQDLLEEVGTHVWRFDAGGILDFKGPWEELTASPAVSDPSVPTTMEANTGAS